MTTRRESRARRIASLRGLLGVVRGDDAPPDPHGGGRGPLLAAVVASALLGGVLLRVVALSADPRYYAWAGYITDEGRWTQQARSLVLFGHADLEYWLAVVHLVVAPLFQAAAWVSFSLFGVGFTSARLVSAAAGCCLLLAIWLFLQRRSTGTGAVLALALVAFQRDLIFLSRVAIPEMSFTLLVFLSFAMLVSGPRSAARAFLGGALTAAALGFKGTNLPIVIVLASVVVVAHQADDPSSRARKVSAYVGAVVAAAAAVLIVAAVVGLRVTGSVEMAWPTLLSFVDLAAPFDAASFLFRGDHAVSINAYLMVAWLVGGPIITAGLRPSGTARAIYYGSAVWALGWLGLAAVLGYFPQRYVFHALVPLAVNVGAGWSILQRRELGESMGESARSAGRRRLVAFWWALPAAIVLGSAVSGTLGMFGMPLLRLSQTLVLVFILTVPLAVVWLRLGPERVAAPVAMFVVVGLAAWLVGSEAGLVGRFWPERGGIGYPLIGLGAALAAVVPAMLKVSAQAAAWAPLSLAGVGTMLSVVQALPAIASPSYSMVEASREIDGLLAGRELVWTDRAGSVFLATGLRYREGYEFESPEVVVDMFNPVLDRFSQSLYLDRQFQIELGEDYLIRNDVEPYVRLYRSLPTDPS